MFGQRLVQYGMRSDGPIQAELYICNPLEGFASKARQYMYVNGRYVAGDAASKLLNNLFQQVKALPVHYFHNILFLSRYPASHKHPDQLRAVLCVLTF